MRSRISSMFRMAATSTAARAPTSAAAFVAAGIVGVAATGAHPASCAWWGSSGSKAAPAAGAAGAAAPTAGPPGTWNGMPVETAALGFAPEVPPAITRKHPVKLEVFMETTAVTGNLSPVYKYPYWTFNGRTPGPFIRCRVGDTVQITYANNDATGAGHNIDFHAVTGPGGGAPCLYAEPGQTKTGTFKMLTPGLYVYHCAAAPLPTHVANGMYGLILVEPEEGLPPVDKEFYVMQSEFYTTEGSKAGEVLEHSYADGMSENPRFVVFNGREGALTENPLMVKQGERVRIFFGNGGPNLISSFHVIGAIFDKVYRDADLISPPARGLQTTLVPPGGATVVEFDTSVPGNYTLVDHAIFRVDKGCVGFLKVQGNDAHKEIYSSTENPQNCAGCKLHN